MIQAKIIADSIDPRGNRLTTFVVTFPRIILAEFNTHRMFSRNSASSRAIPFEKMVKSVEENPFIPIAWQKDHKGMQGSEYFSDKENINFNREEWLITRNVAIDQAVALSNNKVTKQLCNRLLEPFMWHTVIVTSGEEGLRNFFELRCPQYKTNFGTFLSIKDAREAEIDITNKNPNIELLETPFKDDVLECLSINEGQSEIHMMALAEAMWDVYNESKPKELKPGEWHIPMIEIIED